VLAQAELLESKAADDSTRSRAAQLMASTLAALVTGSRTPSKNRSFQRATGLVRDTEHSNASLLIRSNTPSQNRNSSVRKLATPARNPSISWRLEPKTALTASQNLPSLGTSNTAKTAT
jgi:hypothetical protein